MDLSNGTDLNQALVSALKLGIMHACYGDRPATASALIQLIAKGEPIYYCNGHARLLRTAYGSGFNAVKFNIRVHKTRQAAKV